MHDTTTAQTATAQTCAHFDCERDATDERHGMPLCLGHFFRALQWEQAA